MLSDAFFTIMLNVVAPSICACHPREWSQAFFRTMVYQLKLINHAGSETCLMTVYGA